ncbi:MAG: hypothetical protein Q8J84_08695 [Flavobacteriaceae bacterium]|nr:hypothetical protein [Flavobacteriaceae bacterium]
MKINKIIKLCREKYSDEVKIKGTGWRIMQLTTFADLIHLEAVDTIKATNPENKLLHVVNIVNLSIKALIQIENGITELTGNYKKDKNNIYLSLSDALNFYDTTWNNQDIDELKLDTHNQELIQEIIKYSLYHKKGITGNSNSYFSYIFSVSINLLNNLIQ